MGYGGFHSTVFKYRSRGLIHTGWKIQVATFDAKHSIATVVFAKPGEDASAA